MDVKEQFPYKLITWTVSHTTVAPHLSIAIRQGWPYAPHQEVFMSLPYAARALILFLTLTTLVFLICGVPVNLQQVSLLAASFTLPFLFLMTGNIPHLNGLTAKEFGSFEVKTLFVLMLPSVFISYFILRKLPRLPMVLTLLLMIFFVGGYPLVGLFPDDQKRKTFENVVQEGMIAFILLLPLIPWLWHRWISKRKVNPSVDEPEH